MRARLKLLLVCLLLCASCFVPPTVPLVQAGAVAEHVLVAQVATQCVPADMDNQDPSIDMEDYDDEAVIPTSGTITMEDATIAVVFAASVSVPSATTPQFGKPPEQHVSTQM